MKRHKPDVSLGRRSTHSAPSRSSRSLPGGCRSRRAAELDQELERRHSGSYVVSGFSSYVVSGFSRTCSLTRLAAGPPKRRTLRTKRPAPRPTPTIVLIESSNQATSRDDV